MKKFLKIFFSIFLLINLCACAQDRDEMDLYDRIQEDKFFIVGTNANSKPFAYKNEYGELVGFDVELIREISKIVFGSDGIVNFKHLTPSSRILKLSTKDVDVVISTMTITPDRMRIISFSNPYFMTGQAILVPENSSIRSGADLNGKKVGIVLGTTAATNIRYVAPDAGIRGFKNYERAFEELENRNIDAISTDDVILKGIISAKDKYKILPDRYTKEYYGIAFRKDKQSEKLKKYINEALLSLEMNGKLRELEKKYEIQYNN